MLVTKDSLEILLGLFAVIGVVWRIAKLEYAIYQAIQKSERTLLDQLNNQNTRFLVYQAETDAFGNKIQLVVDELEHRLETKIAHLAENQRQLQGFLQKTSGFIPRDREHE